MDILLRLASYALRYKRRLILVYICLIGSTLLSLAIPRFVGITIDTALGSGQESRLVLLALLVLAISLVRGGFAYGQSYLAEYLSQHVAYDIRHAFLTRLHSLSFAFHDRQRTGDLMSRATADVESIRWFVSFGLIYSIHILVLVGGVAGLLLTLDWGLALIGLAAVPIAAYNAIRISRRFRTLWMGVQAETGRMTTVLQENLSGMRVVKTFGAEEYEKDKFREVAHVVAEETFIVNRLHAANSSLLNLLFTLVTALVVWYGGWQIVNNQQGAGLTTGELIQFILYLGLLVFPIRMAGWVVNNFSRAVAAGERIFQVLDAPSPVGEKEGAIVLDRVRGEVKFEDVSFSYDSRVAQICHGEPPSPLMGEGRDGGDTPHLSPLPQGERKSHLRKINLEAVRGQKIAILGAPGSGKSTMVSLLPRFYDATQGRVTLDGVDVRDVTLESLRRNVGIVFQDVFLFMTTIRENIAYGVANASFEQIVAAARSAQIDDFIMGLPEQYDTLVGERGVTLSGGQRQRLAIARTLLLDPPILILDDSTSSVDAETESLIQSALDEVMKGRTTFVIAHRVSSVKRADLILVLKDGEIAERGTHQELISREGLYRDIYQLQLHAEEDEMTEFFTHASDN